MELSKPDLSQVDADVRAYIEALEAEIERLQRKPARGRQTSFEPAEEVEPGLPLEPSEPPTTINILTTTASGIAKRTPRHLYTRQRRGGMGVFDLDAPEDEPPSILAVADEGDHLLLITSLARAFRLPMNSILEDEVRARGASMVEKLNLLEDERLAAILPDQAQGYVAMVSERGYVRLLRHHVFGEYMKPGTTLYDTKTFGPLVDACRTPGEADLFIATRQGRAIRFSEKSVPPPGGPGIRLADGDLPIGITSVYPDSGVFMVSADGKGTIRLMEGFSANKAPGAGGKIAMATDQLVSVTSVEDEDDIFILSRLSKIIRFQAVEVPAKEGVVQGVICMSLRSDQVIASVVSPARIRF